MSGFWAVAQVAPQPFRRPGRLSTVEVRLGKAGFETYCPLTRSRDRVAPLFAGYLFVQVVEHWWSVRWTPGVVSVLMAGAQPARVQDRIIAELRGLEVGGFVRLPLPPRFRRGEAVRIANGQFCGLVGLYEGQSAREREIVLLEMFGRKVPVELGKMDQIQAAQ
jgi:transcription antitermination factor NusG